MADATEWRELSVSDADADANADDADLVIHARARVGTGRRTCTDRTLAGLVTEAARRHLDHRSPALSTVEDVQNGRLTVVLVGRPEGYIERLLGDLMTLIQRSRAAGATHFAWG